MNKFENNLWKKNYKLIAGIDEVGRGALAGPIVVAICVLPINYQNKNIIDSKKLSSKKRIEMDEIIKRDCVDYYILKISSKIVDSLNPKKATIYGMEKCIDKILTKPDYVLIDFEKINYPIKSKSIIKGDQKSISIAAASILAKVYRDNYMSKIAIKYPKYGFEKNKGYGTFEHINALEKFGPIKNIHRITYKPIKNNNKKMD